LTLIIKSIKILLMNKVKIKLNRDLYSWERELLKYGKLYLVGGCIRDLYLGIDAESIDEDYLVVDLQMDRIVELLRDFGKVDLVGKSFGVIKFRPTAMPEKCFDISLPRKERSTGIHHRDFDVQFDPDIPVEVDLERRDFTINSMAYCLSTGEVVDPLGGLEDLERRLLRVNRELSFIEDPLRILRGVQFMARFELEVEGKTFELMKKYAELIKTVSPDRVRDELTKLLTKARKPSRGLILCHNTGILQIIIPELDATYGITQNEYHPDDIFMHSLKTCDEIKMELELRWSALLHDVGKRQMKKVVDEKVVFYNHEVVSAEQTEAILKRFKYSNRVIDKVKLLVRHHMFNLDETASDSAIGRFIRRVGRENVDAILELRRADLSSRGVDGVDEQVGKLRERIIEYIKKQDAFSIRDLKVNGHDVMKILGLREGPEVGKVLRKLFNMVTSEPSLNDRERLIEILNGMRSKKGESSCNN